MAYRKKWQNKLLVILAILLLMACNALTGISPTPVTFKPGDPTATPLGSDITDPNFIKGVDAFNAKNYEEVMKFMSAVIESDPNLAPPYRYRGVAYWALGDCQSGLADAEKALSINPDYGAAWGVRGLMYACLGNQDQALQDYQKALSIDPSLAFIHHNLGVYYYQQGDYEKSLEEYSLSVSIDPYRAGAWSGKSEALAKLGRFTECIQSATKAIEVDPTEWLAYAERGFCELNINNFAAGENDYKVYLAQKPNDPEAWVNLGYAQDKNSKPKEAINSYNRALELDPSHSLAHINRGNVFVTLKEYEKALDDFNHALEFGDFPAAYSGRGTAYYWLGRYDDAIADLELATKMMPNRPHSYCMLALSYFEVGRYQDSLDAAATLNQIEPGCGGQRLLEIQARSYYALGEYEEAISYINKAFEMGEFKMGYYYRGIMYQAAGRIEEAISDLERFLVLTKDSNDFTDEIADAKKRLADLKK